ncbi:MAG: ABC transporter permease [Faecalibacterium sp.]|nr:ABC transporter permease [Faecalibacterium sp.]
MGKYVVKRSLLAIVTILIISAITFFAMHSIPGDPFTSEKAIPVDVRAAMEARFNLDKPLPTQFVLYLKGIMTGDWGISMKTGRDIWGTITSRLGVSARLGITAAFFAICIGLVLGCTAALNRNKLPDRLIVFFITLFNALPSFVFGTTLLLIFCLWLKLVPVWSPNNPSYILPVIALAASPMAQVTRLTKTSMLDALSQDYVRTARAKGVKQVFVVFKHALRNALIPVITYVGPMIAYILTGSMVVENIFTIGGLGSQFVTAITNRDYTLIMGTTIFLAILMVIANLLTDIVYTLVDPRIRLE